MSGPVTSAAELAAVRRRYARQMLAVAGVEDAAVEDAFAAVAREAFLGPPPWPIVGRPGQVLAVYGNDPALLYQDVLIPLDPVRGVNNGSPSLHAMLLHHLAPRRGERVAHIGAGTGYYSAILAELVGGDGRVEAVEVDDALAETARRNLAGYRGVTVVAADGAGRPVDEVDAVYVNFAVADLAPPWIDRLGPGGRLVVPLAFDVHRRPGSATAAATGHGGCFLIRREPAGLAARLLSPVSFVCAEGRLATAAPATAFGSGDAAGVRSLAWGRPADPARCWLVGPCWSLSLDPPASGGVPPAR